MDEQQTDPTPAPLTSELDEALERGKQLAEDKGPRILVTVVVERAQGDSLHRNLHAIRDDESSVNQLTEFFEIELRDMIKRAKGER